MNEQKTQTRQAGQRKEVARKEETTQRSTASGHSTPRRSRRREKAKEYAANEEGRRKIALSVIDEEIRILEQRRKHIAQE